MYYTYIITNKNRTVLYIGVTNDLFRRMYEHKNGILEGFSKKYNLHFLMYYEELGSAYDAITREKQLKSLSRKKKNSLIFSMNPKWNDLSEWWYSK